MAYADPSSPSGIVRLAVEEIDGNQWLVMSPYQAFTGLGIEMIYLAIWLASGAGAITGLFTTSDLETQFYLGVWLSFWTLICVFFGRSIAFRLTGQVRICVDGTHLRQDIGMLSFWSRMRFEAENITELRKVPKELSYSKLSKRSQTYDELQFEFDGETHTLMPGTSSGEVEIILEWLQERLPKSAFVQ